MPISKRPFVSIIIPAYRAERFIAETLDSVVNQSHTEWEAFVVDDGSGDKTVDMARKFESGKLSVIVQKNQGACVARNKGLALSSGKYIQFLDADDVLSYDKLEQQVDVLEKNPGCLAISPTVHFMDGEDYITMAPREESAWIFDTDDVVDFLVRLYGGYGPRWMVQTSAWLTPKTICDRIGLWNENLLINQDGEYFARAVLAAKGIRTSDGTNYYRRFVSGTNISAKYNKRENLESALLSLSCIDKYIAGHTQSEAYQRAMATLFREMAINAYPMFGDLVEQCEQRVQKSGQKPDLPVMGGRIVEIIKKTLGWKAAKQIRLLVHKLRNDRA
jgi:glycosyltransferase involved in cell wall biosynthesis